MRAFVIERLMCTHEFSERAIIEKFGKAAEPVIDDAGNLLRSENDGLIERSGDGFRLTPKGKPWRQAPKNAVLNCGSAIPGSAECSLRFSQPL